MAKPKVFLVKPDERKATAHENMFVSRGWERVESFKGADLVQFIGGEDISPNLYNHPTHPTTRTNERRDLTEQWFYDHCLKLGIPMAGICRGGQFLWVMNGGVLHQDVGNHTTPHSIYKKDGELICIASSTHHQQMARTISEEFNPTILAEAVQSTYRINYSEETNKFLKASPRSDAFADDIEAAVFKDTKCLCFQPHPEHNGFNELQDYYFELIWNYLLSKG